MSMELVYTVLILVGAAVIVGVIYMLRSRITRAEAEVSLRNQSAKVKLTATPLNEPEDVPRHETLRSRYSLARWGIIGNVLEWWSHIRAPSNARIINNVLKAGSTIEVTIPSEPSLNSSAPKDSLADSQTNQESRK